MPEKVRFIRQGDLLFIPQTTVDPTRQHFQNARRVDGIIREGEATGHHHRIETLDNAEVFRPSWGDAVVVVGEHGVRIVHEEHGPVVLEPNTTYSVHVAREFDYLAQATRWVRD